MLCRGRSVPLSRRLQVIPAAEAPRDCNGPPGYGTGFLVGEQLVMTAVHVVGAADGRRACRVQVRLGGRWYDTAYATHFMSLRPMAGKRTNTLQMCG
jgi:hypothetical protein